MAVNDKSNLVIKGYNRGTPPVLDEGYKRYIQDELHRIETSVRSLAVAGIEVLDEPPKNPIKGMVKYAVSGWDPIGDGTTGLVYYNGTSWQTV